MKPTSKITDPVFKKYGSPFLVSGTKVTLNHRAVAVKCATMHSIQYNTSSKRYERYDQVRGLWVGINEVSVTRLLDDLLLELGASYDHQPVVNRITAANLSSLAKMMKPHDMKVASESTAGLVHVSNGIVALDGNKVRLVKHDAKYPFRHSSEISYDAKATCTNFQKKLLGAALAKEDVELLQKYCGSMLWGTNSCHGILVIRGTPGGGKSTLVSVIEKIIGENNVAHLRTLHLGERFETSAFLGKRLLVGKDVPSDTLSVGGARMLKSLVGGDLVQAEIKFNPDKRQLRGDFHVIVVSNNKLRIALDGDEEAWRRRLLVVDFTNPKPARPIPNFAEELIAKESSGILNWLIAGAMAYRTEMEKRGHLQLTNEQQNRVDTLLEDSDNIPVFVDQCLTPKKGGEVTSEEALLCYYKVCKNKEWTPEASHTFQTRLPDLMAQAFKATRRNDILRDGRAVRGFKNVALV